MNIVMKTSAHVLPDRFTWLRTDAGHDLYVDDTLIAEIRPVNAGLMLRVCVDMGDIAPFEMAVRCEERAIGWATQWARQRAGLLCRYADRRRTAGVAPAGLALAS
ncbi:hypothetical protein ASD77_00945 [Pseudoxanthomonas sp. Root65]|nr:hypothetical protein ASD77_00945 [Pseudoxanthomonas sp. Root65]